MSPKSPLFGFTLAELLIALVILGEIATFTIPKILISQSNGRNNAIAKETMASIASAYQMVQLNSSGGVSFSTTIGALTQYMNYVAVDTTSTIDAYPGSASDTFPCSSYTCIKLHNGGLFMMDIIPFGSSGGIVDGVLDPDGTLTSRKDSISFILYYKGRVQTIADYTGNASYTPTWFSY